MAAKAVDARKRPTGTVAFAGMARSYKSPPWLAVVVHDL